MVHAQDWTVDLLQGVVLGIAVLIGRTRQYWGEAGAQS
jgi:hypothetical protein